MGHWLWHLHSKCTSLYIHYIYISRESASLFNQRLAWTNTHRPRPTARDLERNPLYMKEEIGQSQRGGCVPGWQGKTCNITVGILVGAKDSRELNKCIFKHISVRSWKKSLNIRERAVFCPGCDTRCQSALAGGLLIFQSPHERCVFSIMHRGHWFEKTRLSLVRPGPPKRTCGDLQKPTETQRPTESQM